MTDVWVQRTPPNLVDFRADIRCSEEGQRYSSFHDYFDWKQKDPIPAVDLDARKAPMVHLVAAPGDPLEVPPSRRAQSLASHWCCKSHIEARLCSATQRRYQPCCCRHFPSGRGSTADPIPGRTTLEAKSPHSRTCPSRRLCYRPPVSSSPGHRTAIGGNSGVWGANRATGEIWARETRTHTQVDK